MLVIQEELDGMPGIQDAWAGRTGWNARNSGSITGLNARDSGSPGRKNWTKYQGFTHFSVSLTK